MEFFSKTVDMRSRKAMVSFLRGYHRYDTMNSCNRSTSYSHKVKVDYLGLTSEQTSKAFDLMSADDSIWDELSLLIEDFTADMGGRYTIASNGRSSGYLVLYQSAYESTGYKSHCRSCRQRNYRTVAETGNNACGRCSATGDKGRIDYAQSPTKLSVYPGKSIDHCEEFDPEEWPLYALKERVELVQKFDQACDSIRDQFIEMIGNFEVVEEMFMVPTKRRSIVESHARG